MWELAVLAVDRRLCAAGPVGRELVPGAGSASSCDIDSANSTEVLPRSVVVEAHGSYTVGELSSVLFGKNSHAGSPLAEVPQLLVDGVRVPRDVPLGPGMLVRGTVIEAVAYGPHRRGEASSRKGAGKVIARLEFLTGVRAGTEVGLLAAETVLGRQLPDVAADDLRTVDLGSSTVSAQHASVTASDVGGRATFVVRDLGSTNSTTVDGLLLGANDVVVADDGAVLRLGSVLVRLRGGPGTVAVLGSRSCSARSVDRRGTRTHNRPPRLDGWPSDTSLRVPETAPQVNKPKLRWVSIVLPLAFAAVIVLVTGDPRFAVLAMLGPILALGTFGEDHRVYRRQRRNGEVAAAQRVNEFAAELALRHHRALVRAHDVSIDPVRARRRANGEETGLWERRARHDDFASVTVGYGAASWQPTLAGRSDQTALPVAIQEVVDQNATLDDAPVSASLRAGRCLGVVGSRAETQAAVRSMIAELAVSSGPADLRIALVTSDDRVADWGWAPWLPHFEPWCEGVGEISVWTQTAEIDQALGALMTVAVGRGPVPLVLLILDDESLTTNRHAGLRSLMAAMQGPAGAGSPTLSPTSSAMSSTARDHALISGVSMIAISANLSELPAVAGEVLVCHGDGTASMLRSRFAAQLQGDGDSDHSTTDVVPVGSTPQAAWDVSRPKISKNLDCHCSI